MAWQAWGLGLRKRLWHGGRFLIGGEFLGALNSKDLLRMLHALTLSRRHHMHLHAPMFILRIRKTTPHPSRTGTATEL